MVLDSGVCSRLVWAGLLGCLLACAPGGEKGNTEKNLATVSTAENGTTAENGCAGAAPFPGPAQQARIVHAENLRITYHDHYKVVELRNGESGADGEWPEKLVLVQCGASRPPLAGELAGAALIEIPVRTVATNAVSDLARLRELGLAERVVGIASAAIYDEDYYRCLQAGKIVAIGHPGHGQPNYEALLGADPDLTLLWTTGPEHAAGLVRLRELGLAAAPSYTFAERSYLSQAEWIKYLALFFNAEERANTLFDAMATSYAELSAKARAAAGTNPRKGFWGGSAGGNRWWTERNGPAAGLLEDAGAVNLLADPEAGPFATLETAVVLERAADADFFFTSVLDENEWDGRLSLEPFRAYREGRFYHNRLRVAAGRDASDWNELALARPDLALADVVFLLYPELLPNHQLQFFGPVVRHRAKS